jgi:hypothetical protein
VDFGPPRPPIRHRMMSASGPSCHPHGPVRPARTVVERVTSVLTSLRYNSRGQWPRQGPYMGISSILDTVRVHAEAAAVGAIVRFSARWLDRAQGHG